MRDTVAYGFPSSFRLDAEKQRAMHGYDFGLMAHQGILAGLNTSYPVFLVDYWVENVQ